MSETYFQNLFSLVKKKNLSTKTTLSEDTSEGNIRGTLETITTIVTFCSSGRAHLTPVFLPSWSVS